jgi:hypothetical protein
LGFKHDYFEGRWEIDNCNGRKGESAAGDHLRKHSSEAIKAWLDQVALPELTPKLKKELKKSYESEYKWRLEEAIRRMVQEKAEKDAKALVESLTQSTQINNHLKMMALLDIEK